MGRYYENPQQAIYNELVEIRMALKAILALLQQAQPAPPADNPSTGEGGRG